MKETSEAFKWFVEEWKGAVADGFDKTKKKEKGDDLS